MIAATLYKWCLNNYETRQQQLLLLLCDLHTQSTANAANMSAAALYHFNTIIYTIIILYHYKGLLHFCFLLTINAFINVLPFLNTYYYFFQILILETAGDKHSYWICCCTCSLMFQLMLFFINTYKCYKKFSQKMCLKMFLLLFKQSLQL